MAGWHVLIGVSGAVNAVRMPVYLHALKARGVARRLTVVLTASAAGLVAKAALDFFADDVFVDEDAADWRRVNHIELARAADSVVVCPATAGRLAQAAHGHADDLLSLVLLAHDAPVLFVPSMNDAMYRHPAVQRNLATLKGDGHEVAEYLVDALEVCTGERSTAPGLPTPARWVEDVRAHCLKVTARDGVAREHIRAS